MADARQHGGRTVQLVAIRTVDGQTLPGDLMLPAAARGVVVFAHGSGSSRRSPRNRVVAEALYEARVGTLLLDLLTPAEADVDDHTRALRFDIPRLTERVLRAIDWLRTCTDAEGLPIGLFGASTGAAAALRAAAVRPVASIVSRGGRTDLADDWLPRVAAPTLFIVGGADPQVLELNGRSLERLGTERRRLAVVPGAGHLFAEPGTMDEVVRLTRAWLVETLAAPPRG